MRPSSTPDPAPSSTLPPPQAEELTDEGAIPGALHIPLASLQAALALPPAQWEAQFSAPAPKPETPIVFSCKMGIRSGKAVALATGLGFTNVSNYTGGWVDWSAMSQDTQGLVISTLQPGDGVTFPRAGQRVACHYVLTLEVQIAKKWTDLFEFYF